MYCSRSFALAGLLALLFSPPAAAVDLIWTDDITNQILRGAADGSGSAS